jgi:hypothetical protein
MRMRTTLTTATMIAAGALRCRARVGVRRWSRVGRLDGALDETPQRRLVMVDRNRS